jgi:DNA repair protein RecO (recombination protein O)
MSGDKLHKTKGVVLRSVKYGETSLIVTIYTELFGLQSYLINGIRVSGKKGAGKANYFQPAALLDLVVYHNEFSKLQRVREFKWALLYEQLYQQVTKNTVALFMIEILQKVLKQPEPHPELFQFIEDAFLHLDRCQEKATANYPLFFLLQLTHFYGLRVSDTYSPAMPVLDLLDGSFTREIPPHGNAIGDPYAEKISQLLKVMHPQELEEIVLNRESRKKILEAVLQFYTLHFPEFGLVRSLDVLQMILH